MKQTDKQTPDTDARVIHPAPSGYTIDVYINSL